MTKATNDDVTPLVIAAHSGHAAVLRLLLDAGVDASDEANHGHSILATAHAQGHSLVVEALLHHASPDSSTGEAHDARES